MNQQRRLRPWLLSVSAAAALAACGGGGGSGADLLGANTSTALPVEVATFTDAAVSGLEYSSPSTSGITDVNGNFEYVPGETVTFALGQVVLGSTAPSGSVVRPIHLVPDASSDSDVRVTRILRTLQSLDSDGDPETDGIHIEAGTREHLRTRPGRTIHLADASTTDADVAAVLPTGGFTVDAVTALAHAEAHAEDESNAHLGYVPPMTSAGAGDDSEQRDGLSSGSGDGSGPVGDLDDGQASGSNSDGSTDAISGSSDDHASAGDSSGADGAGDHASASSSSGDDTGDDASGSRSSGDAHDDDHASAGSDGSSDGSNIYDDDHASDDSTGSTGSTGTTTPVAQPAITSGRLLASNCFQCHGTGGWGGFDRIRGGEASEVFEYTGRTANTSIMAAHAQGFTRAQLNAIVTYLNQ